MVLAVLLAISGAWDDGGHGLLVRLRRVEARYYANRAQLLLEQGDLHAAIDRYHSAIAADPDQWIRYAQLGLAYERLAARYSRGDMRREEALRQAVVCHQRVATHVPRLQHNALLRLAALHGPAGLDEPASLEADLDQLVRGDRPEVDWYLALARLRVNGGRHAQAESTLLRGRELFPHAGMVHRELARLYRHQERPDDHMRALRLRLRGAPDDRDALLATAEASFYRAFRDFRISAEQQRALIGRGLDASRRLVRLEPGHVAARHYESLLARLQPDHSVSR
jgi:tetratricopeptide (TPR) repeat protein